VSGVENPHTSLSAITRAEVLQVRTADVAVGR